MAVSDAYAGLHSNNGGVAVTAAMDGGPPSSRMASASDNNSQSLTALRHTPSRPEATAAAPAFSIWLRPFLAAFGALVIIWLPLALMSQVDGMRLYLAWQEIGGDTALLVVLLGAVAAVLTMFGIIGAYCWASEREHRDAVARAIILCPVALICAWQFTRGTKIWVEHVSGLP